ncbi:MAG: 4Fe-4S binding protein [Thaumarchaeota archaeon]|nr:4Fe-4S binding protein [Candidatus Calditenuaceae archaeon]MDW8186874.1 4Fe-4S binding protein [Nitrososphaerota archaeon]
MVSLKEVLGPLWSAAKHVFAKPYTYKYPYERVPSALQENYRYDPKAGIAYPGSKGRHLLRLDKCTGCSLCDIACQNIAEAITMVYAYDVVLEMPERAYSELGKKESPVTGAVDLLMEGFNRYVTEDHRGGFSHPVMPVLVNLKNVSKTDSGYVLKLNSDAVWANRLDLLVRDYFEDSFRAMITRGYEVRIAKDESPDRVLYELIKDDVTLVLRVEKRNMNIPVNKKSYFPMVDYGRCVFCGFCVDACPFYALEMTPDFELSSTSRVGMVYNPIALSGPKISTAPPSTNPIDAIMGWLRRKTS